MVKWRALLVAGALALSLPVKASAYHTKEDRQTDFSAFTLHQNQWRLGLFQAEYGIFDWWNVGTYTLPWFLMPISKSPAINLYTKVKFLDVDGWAAALRLNAFFIQLNNVAAGDLDDGDFTATVFPITLVTSRVFNDEWTASLESTWVQSAVRGKVDSAADGSALGAGAQSNLQFALTGEYRVTETLALNFVGRYVPYVTAARITTNADAGDETEVSIEAEIDASGVQNAWLLQTGFTLSWKVFNLQFGFGYGNVIFPGMKIVAPLRTIMPDFDLYFRF